MPGKSSGIESYVVRIYRRGREEPKELIGVVERAGDAAQHAFKTPDELLQILAAPEPAPGRRTRESGSGLRVAERPPDDSR
jgi:hypothetical protein